MTGTALRIAAGALGVWLVLAPGGAGPVRAQGQTAEDLLASARQAMGTAVLSSITAWSVIGTQTTHHDGHDAEFSLEIFCELPDRFVEIRTQRTPFGDLVNTNGFNGDELVRDVRSALPVPPDVSFLSVNATAADIARERTSRVDGRKRAFINFALPLFAQSFSSYPVAFSAVGQFSLNGSAADVIEASGRDEIVWRLFLDAKTHLPVMLNWLGTPVVTFTTSTSSIVSVRRGTAEPVSPPVPTLPPTLPANIPTPAEIARLPKVPHNLSLSEYKVNDGLNWPHRFKEYVDGKLVEDIRFGRFRINPKINPRVFTPAK